MGAQDIKLDGATSQIIEVMIRDSTTGQGKTGIAFGSVTGRYIRQGAASATTITMATATLGTFTSGGWIEIDAANCPGMYQAGIVNASIAAGVGATTLTFKISGAIDKTVVLLLTPPVDSQYWSGTANATPDTAGFPKVTIKDGTGQGEIDTTAGAVATTGGGGSGARTVTITVNDGATVIIGAIVRLTLGVDTYTATTIAGGIATFNVNDGTWTVGITKAGYTYAGTTIVVDGTETATYSMSAVTITPAAAGQTNAYLTTRTGGGTVLGSVVVTFKMVAGPGTVANSYNSKEFTATSHASTGLLEVTLLQSATYYGIRGDGTEIQFTTGTDGTYALPEILGEDAN